MNKITKDRKSNIRLLGFYGVGIILIWTFFIVATLIWQKKNLRNYAIEAARIEARQAFLNHTLYRSWNSSHGGIWAPVSGSTQPNPYLNVTEREIKTPSGILLTKINPAYMTRQVNELALEKHGILGHITSLNPLRPENKADQFETWALEKFEQGETEVSSLVMLNSTEYLRLMRPLVTEQSCLACHAQQGYKTGDIRGGISVTIPIAPHIAVGLKDYMNLDAMYGFLWLAGLFGTVFFMLILYNQLEKRFNAEDELIQQEKLEGVIEMARAVCHELNQPLQTIMGNSEIILLEGLDHKTLMERTRKIKEQADRMGKLSEKLIHISDYRTKDMLQGRVIDIDKSSKNLP